MIVLGIHYGHNATVSVVRDGELVFCQSEERFNRIKNSTGFPSLTLEYVYSNVCSPDEVVSVVLFQESIYGYLHLKQHDFKPYQYGNYLSPEDDYTGFFERSELRWKLSQWRSKALRENSDSLRHESMKYWEYSTRQPRDKIHFINHHMGHAYSTYPNVAGWGNVLFFTLDGQGDYLSSTVSQLSGDCFKKIQSTSQRNSIGMFYSAITSIMGMKSGEHEFKVMGLAPYSQRKYYQPILDKMEKLIHVNKAGEFIASCPPTALKGELSRVIKYQRFDNIAGAIQSLTEDLILKWIKYWIMKTGVRNISLSGGVFMNVKACQRIVDANIADNIYVMPSAADESTSIGAAFYGAIQNDSKIEVQPIKDLYLGKEYLEEEIVSELDASCVSERYEISQPDNINCTVAKLLSEDKVVARYAGRMEFGARALGNRSILANPRSFETIELINSSIKSRDFWMPFTPSVLDVDMDRYIVDHKKIFAPYMCVTFNTTELAQQHLKAAIHPRDKTARPQCVLRSWNPGYYELIEEFKKITGIGAVLNTSFNLHGEPNVCSPRDAIHTMDNSELKYLAMGSFLIVKKTEIN